MTTYADLAEKHATMRRCKNTKGRGCGEQKPIDDFPFSFVTNDCGRRSRRCGYLCKPCQSELDRINQRKHKSNIRGPECITEAERLFYRQVKPTPLSVELRKDAAV